MGIAFALSARTAAHRVSTGVGLRVNSPHGVVGVAVEHSLSNLHTTSATQVDIHNSMVLDTDSLNLCSIVRLQPPATTAGQSILSNHANIITHNPSEANSLCVVRVHIEELAALSELFGLGLHRCDLFGVAWIVLLVAQFEEFCLIGLRAAVLNAQLAPGGVLPTVEVLTN